MHVGTRRAPNDPEALAGPQSDRPVVRREDEVELDGCEPPLPCAGDRVVAYRRGDALSPCIRTHHVAGVADVRAWSELRRTEEVRADHVAGGVIAAVSDPRLEQRRPPVRECECRLSGPVAWQRPSLAGADRRFKDRQNRVVIAVVGEPEERGVTVSGAGRRASSSVRARAMGRWGAMGGDGGQACFPTPLGISIPTGALGDVHSRAVRRSRTGIAIEDHDRATSVDMSDRRG